MSLCSQVLLPSDSQPDQPPMLAHSGQHRARFAQHLRRLPVASFQQPALSDKTCALLRVDLSHSRRVGTRSMTSHHVMWFRKGLRVHDNPALLEANDSASALFPVFCLDPCFIKTGDVGPHRISFLLQSLRDLDANLRTRGSQLIVLQGNPKDVLPEVVRRCSASKLCFEKDTEPYALERDAAVRASVEEIGAQVCIHTSHTLWDSDELIKRNGGAAPDTMKSFTALTQKVGVPPRPASAPEKLVAADAGNLEALREWLHGPSGAVPSLGDLDIVLPGGQDTPFPGGETEGLSRMKEQLKDASWVCNFEKPKGNPTQFEPNPATTVMSPYMKFGCVSARTFYHSILEVYSRGSGHTGPPSSLLAQLLWREFFYTVGYDTPNFHRMEGNPGARQIPWEWDKNKIEAWDESRTGYPWIDACMSQLRMWGWMHHLARHAVAAFLTRGDLFQHWEAGVRIFDKYLIDADYFVNNGNWQWLSATRFYYQYFKCYSPITFGRKYDPEGKFIRHFLPVLKNMPSKYIYEPWKAPMDVQQKAKCIIGTDYPEPLVDHKQALQENKAKLKAAYTAGRAGKDAAQEQKKGYPEEKLASKEARAGGVCGGVSTKRMRDADSTELDDPGERNGERG